MACVCTVHISHLASCNTSCSCAGPVAESRAMRKSDGGKIIPPAKIETKDGDVKKRVDRMG